LEDLLDSWPGTLVVVSHDRYFVERVCDNVYGLMGDGGIRHLPGGIEQYVQTRREPVVERIAGAPPAKAATPGAVLRAARKEVARLERALEKLDAREADLHEAMAASATEHARLGELNAELVALRAEREEFEAAWFEASAVVEG
ncbi:MAG: transport system ATP-binding/permease protein, partial [Thermoleophilaceae bacterium]|nr:transport system ATP-binding/permease protein [Thermoleophilaceae bacterium]